MAQKTELAFEREENTMVKERILVTSIFSQCFEKLTSISSLKYGIFGRILSVIII